MIKTARQFFYNQTMAEIDGLTQSDVVGKNIFHLYPSLTNETSTLNLALSKGIKTVDVMQTYVFTKENKFLL
ncbi:hypothetical protein KHA80_21895 [Anaerobacillus sp. HL2]|nr:hypothetical protein KHA80_21895 [Anaerobacillus sp. HL2]